MLHSKQQHLDRFRTKEAAHFYGKLKKFSVWCKLFVAYFEGAYFEFIKRSLGGLKQQNTGSKSIAAPAFMGFSEDHTIGELNRARSQTSDVIIGAVTILLSTGAMQSSI